MTYTLYTIACDIYIHVYIYLAYLLIYTLCRWCMHCIHWLKCALYTLTDHMHIIYTGCWYIPSILFTLSIEYTGKWYCTVTDDTTQYIDKLLMYTLYLYNWHIIYTMLVVVEMEQQPDIHRIFKPNWYLSWLHLFHFNILEKLPFFVFLLLLSLWTLLKMLDIIISIISKWWLCILGVISLSLNC